jgi:predicted TIM-barrel fold metal-dependent hydrolase
MTVGVSRRAFLGAVGAAGALGAAMGGVDAGTARAKGLVIDSHVHLKHGDAAKTEFPAKAIVGAMDGAGIDRSVVFAMSTSARRAIEMAEAAVAQYPDRLIPYAYALPSYERPVIKDIESALAGGVFRGIKVHAAECTLADYVIDPVLKLAGRFDVPCLIDATGNVAAARRIAEAFPGTNVIYAHMGRYKAPDARLIDAFIRLAGEHEKVFLDLSGVSLDAKIAEAVRLIGARKLVWGTDGPYAQPDLATFARNELEKVRRQPISPEDKDDVLGGNIARLLKLKDRA